MKAVFIDVETTGLDFNKHVPLDVAAIVVDLHDMSCVASYSSLIKLYSIQWDDADQEALNVNGFNIDNHHGYRESWEIGQELLSFFLENDIVRGRAVFICQNPSFDRAFIHKLLPQSKMNEFNLPYHWLDLASMYWIKMIDINKPVNGHNLPCHTLSSLSKDNIAMCLGIPTEPKPHKALGGVLHLISCYKALVSYREPSSCYEALMNFIQKD